MITAPQTDLGLGGPPPIAEEAMALHSKLAALPDDVFISFQDVDFLALNPNYSNWATPRAVYGIPVPWLRTISNVPGLTQKQMQRIPLANLGCARRPYALAFRIEGRVLDMNAFVNFPEHAALLRTELLERGRSELVSRVNNYLRSGLVDDPGKYWKEAQRAGRYMLYLTEEITDDFLGIRHQEGPYRQHPDKPETWRNFLRMAGFDAVLDNASFLTGDFRQQIAVLDDSTIRLLEMFPNPCASHVQEPSPLSEKIGAPRPI